MNTTAKSLSLENRTRLRAHFQDVVVDSHPKRWDDCYVQDFTPWDKGLPNPALVDLLTERGQELFGPSFVVDPAKGQRRKKALVPGCGKGYDVLLLAAFGYDAYGLDTSQRALDLAREQEKVHGGDEVYAVRDKEIGKGSVNWISGDFFKDGFLKDVGGDGTFDLLYDFTFLSALPISLRPAWAKRFHELLAPTGKLICLEFPTHKPANSGGPPWSLPPKVYEGHLGRPGQKLPYSEDEELLENEVGPETENALGRLEHFQPKRTHDMGYHDDGTVADWISIWAHTPTA